MPAKAVAVAGAFSIQNPGPGAVGVTSQTIAVVGPDQQRYDLSAGAAAAEIAAGQTVTFTLSRTTGFPARGVYSAYVRVQLASGGILESASAPVPVDVWEDVAQDYQPGDGSIRTRTVRVHGDNRQETIADVLKQAAGQLVITFGGLT